MSNPVTLRALLGDYPVTRALRRGEVTSPDVRLDFADVTLAPHLNRDFLDILAG